MVQGSNIHESNYERWKDVQLNYDGKESGGILSC